jgi:hypothetical protein
VIGYKYLIDNNALSKLTRQQRASNFFHQNCLIPTEVLHEARGYPDADQLSAVEYRTTGRVLGILGEVMATVASDDTTLVDLYGNRGNADPLLVACALDGNRDAEDGLFGWTWVIVSNDKAVRAKASSFDIKVRTSDEFASVLEGAGAVG